MNRLKQLRKEKGLTQNQLAEEISVHYRTLQNWENNKGQIKPNKIQQLADYFEVSDAYLLGYSDFRNPIEQIASIKGKDLGDGKSAISQTDLNQSFLKPNFIKFSKVHDLALSNDDIDKVIDLIKSLNDTNTKMLNNFVTAGDIEKLEELKGGDFSNLFAYSTEWSDKYNSLKNTDN